MGWVDLIQVLSLQPPDAEIVYLIPDGQRHKALEEGFRSPTFEYLYQGAAQVHLLHTAMPNLARKIESTLAAMENISTVKVVDWDTNAAWAGDESDRFAVLFGKYGRYMGSDAYGSFQIHNYTDIVLDRPWTFYEDLEPLTVYYDGDIALEGIALGQGERAVVIAAAVESGPGSIVVDGPAMADRLRVGCRLCDIAASVQH